ncbi:putative peroxidase [Rosa chinensis]|uniref:Peroxidase n=1 Tax=Rosa chinensis TaxID=74649 RepID=A0A2P6QE69_ROSCH|nr:peroxidase 60 [Rosa chinensis]PRQ32483.1 putative peroxidase [Rosa chinensis]
MKMSSRAHLVAVGIFGLIFVSLTGQCYGALEVGFYERKCLADVEKVVADVVKAKYKMDRTIAAALVRMQFHDCFVNGCDASILLDGSSSEKTAPPNLSVRGYDVIDAAKAAVEVVCPGKVSCSDIIVMATREAVCLSGGGRYSVQTGRRDGFVSLASNVDLPAPSISVNQSVAAFARKGLNAIDMVYLLGGHTIGVAHCFLFQDRLYNFQNTGGPDRSMDSSLLQKLRSICPQNSAGSKTADLDQNEYVPSSFIVDNSFYKQIRARRGVLQIDQELAFDPITQSTVTTIANSFGFSAKFGQAMVKLGAVGVLTGTQGEIRKSCRAVNTP